MYSTNSFVQILSTLLKAGLGPEVLGISEIESIATFLQSQFQNHGGIVGFGESSGDMKLPVLMLHKTLDYWRMWMILQKQSWR